jgi:hypothetical protein
VLVEGTGEQGSRGESLSLLSPISIMQLVGVIAYYAEYFVDQK